MCTVTYIKGSYGRVITSNRDENIRRAPSLPPAPYAHSGHTLWYPRDTEKGGTWFASRGDGWLGVLLNGAGTPFEANPAHQKSRGHVVLEVLGSKRPISRLMDIGLSETAPFTLVLSHTDLLMELRWDGSKKDLVELDPTRPRIWSSSTLYTREMADRKRHLFEHFLASHPNGPTPLEILEFHKGRYQEEGNDFLIARANGIQTISITQACPQLEADPMGYWVSANRNVGHPSRICFSKVS